MITLEQESDLQNTQPTLKEMTEPLLNQLNLTKTEHLFVAAKSDDNTAQLKSFIEDHPEIIFDFVVVWLIFTSLEDLARPRSQQQATSRAQ